MDCGNYSYTAPGFGCDPEKILAYFEDDNGYYKITIEQWKCDQSQKEIVVSIFFYSAKNQDIVENFTYFPEIDYSFTVAFEKARNIYNKYVPEKEIIPFM